MFEARSLILSVCGIDWPLKPRCRSLCSPASSKTPLSGLMRLPLWSRHMRWDLRR